VTPRLSPAYDIVTTRAYIREEQQTALNMAKTKAWYELTLAHFEYWANKAEIPWRAIKPHLDETMDMARSQWPTALQELPMRSEHKQCLIDHWSNLMPDFRITL
jgi:serine/threonine-protein kinase HipA